MEESQYHEVVKFQLTTWGTIQNAINNAQSGDTIMLENGATFSGVGNTQITISKNLIFDVLKWWNSYH